MNLGSMRHEIALENPAGTTPDGHGGYRQTWAPLVPGKARAQITNASTRVLERLFSNTVTVQASYIVNMRFHPDVTTKTRIRWTDRSGDHLASVTDVADVDLRGIELNLLVTEITT